MILNFNLPKELYKQVDSYDLNKPKEVKQKSQRPANTFPKAGIPEQLIPENVVPKEVIRATIDRLNARDHSGFYSGTAYSGSHENIHFVISQKASKYWSAVWFDTNSEIVFHYSYCLRNLKSYKTYHWGTFWNSTCHLKEEDFNVVKHGKKEYLYYHAQVTKEDLINRKYVVKELYCSTYNIGDFMNLFRARIKKHILVWDKQDVFSAYSTSLASVLNNYSQSSNFDWVPDFKYVVSKYDKKFASKIDTPFFRKKINMQCQKVIDLYYDSKNYSNVGCKLNTVPITILNWVNYLYDNQLSVDHLQQIWIGLDFDSQRYLNFYSSNPNQTVIDWFKQNVPVKSFINMFTREYQNTLDSVQMIRDVLSRNPDIKYTGRWRATEFHDWIMSEQWKICNKNQNLPQDLFPTPIKIGKMTFIQPINTHQLSQWGQAARNCVGSSTYYDGILKKNHFIILALKENEPYLTIQAVVENNQLRVTQIKKTCNASLNHDEQTEYHKVFEQALMIRSAELAELAESSEEAELVEV